MKLLYFLLYSNLFISFCAFCITLTSFLIAGATNFLKDINSLPYSLFISLSVFIVYSLDRTLLKQSPEDAINKPELKKWNLKYKKFLIPAVFFSLLFCNYFFLNFSLLIKVTLIILFLFTVLYLLSVKKLTPLLNINNFWLKPFFITAVWFIVCIFLPFYIINHQGSSVFPRWIVFSGAILVLFFCNALVFDIIDFAGDLKFEKHSAVVSYGPQKIHSLALFLLFGCCFVVILSAIIKKEFDFILFVIPHLFFLIFLKIHSFEKLQNKQYLLFYSYFIDGLLIVPLPLALLV